MLAAQTATEKAQVVSQSVQNAVNAIEQARSNFIENGIKGDKGDAGPVNISSSTDSESETTAASSKAVKTVKALVISVRNALNNYIPNSKKSDDDNSSSSDTIATSYAVKKVRDIAENRFSS
ncbi:TPA: tail fiber protein, partial [Pasteurella multocida]|nr:tail fiber protein [Pasteurella multocida]